MIHEIIAMAVIGGVFLIGISISDYIEFHCWYRERQICKNIRIIILAILIIVICKLNDLSKNNKEINKNEQI